MKLKFTRQIFEKYSNIKFHENPSSGSLDVQFVRTRGHRRAEGGRTDMTKVIVAFRNFVNAHKNQPKELLIQHSRVIYL